MMTSGPMTTRLPAADLAVPSVCLPLLNSQLSGDPADPLRQVDVATA
jgi:hypothetical protein